MNVYRGRKRIAILAQGLVLLVAGCALKGSIPNSVTGDNPIAVTLTGPSTVNIGVDSVYTAVVTGTTNQAVTWSINQVPGGNVLLGTITSAGIYTPPATMPASADISIAAVSVADTNDSQTLSVKILPALSKTAPAESVTVTGPATVFPGAASQYSAVVAGTSDQDVQWSVNGTAGGSTTIGSISTSGLYTPPATIPSSNSVIIGAASTALSGVSGTLNVTMTQPVPAIITAVGSTADSGQTFLVDVQGTNFASNAVLLVGGAAVTTVSVGQNDLQTTITESGGQPGQITLIVENVAPGQAQSAPVTISLTIPVTTAAAAARFLDQTSFGPTPETIAHVQQIGLQAALTEQFNQTTTLYSDPGQSEPECTNETFRCTRSEFINVAAFGQDQFRERVALALSEIWVASTITNNEMPFYLNSISQDSFTNYRTIMEDITLTPEMGEYLNMLNNAKAENGQIANENFARELMQLFSIGLNMLNADGSLQLDSSNNPIPTFTELQVEAFAKAYTGWTYANADGSTPGDFIYTPTRDHKMVPVEHRHDMTQKAVLNGTVLPSGQSAAQDLKGAFDNVFQHPNVGPFICRQLIQHLVTGSPSPAYVQRVAAVFADNGQGVRGDMQSVLTAIIMDQEARAGDNQTADDANTNPAVDGGHLREPMLWVTDVLRGVHATPAVAGDPYPYISFLTAGLGNLQETPFTQTSVFNFFPPQYVIPQTSLNAPEFALENTGTVIPRQTLADSILHNHAVGLNIDVSATSAIGRKAGIAANLVDYLGMIFMHSQMPTAMRSSIIANVAAIPSSNVQERAQVAIYLIITSSEYKIIH